MRSDAHAYDGRLWIVASHLMAAKTAASGLYETNPLTHGYPPMDDLIDRLDALLGDVQAARKVAAAIEKETDT